MIIIVGCDVMLCDLLRLRGALQRDHDPWTGRVLGDPRHRLSETAVIIVDRQRGQGCSIPRHQLQV